MTGRGESAEDRHEVPRADLARAQRTFFGLIAATELVLLGTAAVTRTLWMANLSLLGAHVIVRGVFRARDAVGARIVTFAALQAGGLLCWDWLHVEVLHTLTYPSVGPFLVRSPVYMPFMWTITLSPIFALSVALHARGERTTAVIAATVAGSVFYAASEILAVRAGWWTYARAPMLAGVPVYLLLTYPLWLALSTALCPGVARAKNVGIVARATAALAWCGVVTAMTWLVAVAPFR